MFIGIDISKKYLDIAFFQDGKLSEKACRIENTPEKIQKWSQTLQNVSLVVLEATGGYEKALISVLPRQGGGDLGSALNEMYISLRVDCSPQAQEFTAGLLADQALQINFDRFCRTFRIQPFQHIGHLMG
jgi:hypothetical protein